MKMMQGEFCLACSNRSRTREAPTPTNISTKSEPEMREERHAGLTRDGAGQQRLAGARRAVEQHALRDPGAERLELLRVLEELLDLVQLLDGLVHARDVAERDPGPIHGRSFGPCASERARRARCRVLYAVASAPRRPEAPRSQAAARGLPTTAGRRARHRRPLRPRAIDRSARWRSRACSRPRRRVHARV